MNKDMDERLDQAVDLLNQGRLQEGKDASSLVQDRLRMIEWNFTDRLNSHTVKAIHPYPAKCIPEIPKALLSALPMPNGTAVLDPFCGCGTTLVEAQRLGLLSVGIDLNPIACLISRVKTAPTPLHLDRIAKEVADVARHNHDPIRWHIPDVDYWFKPEIQEAIAALVQEIGIKQKNCSNDTLRLALSSIIVRVSNQRSDTRYAAIYKPVTRDDVFDYFLAACRKISRALIEREWEPLLQPLIIEADTLKTDPSVIGMPVGMVITSPPYPNAYEYWLYHKYRMWWLGFDPLAVRSKEIGARARFFKQESHAEENFWDQMRGAFAFINSVLVALGFACVVIGRSKIHGQIIDNAGIIKAVAEEQGLSTISSFERVISAIHKSLNLSHANIRTETVIIFQKK